MPSRKNYGGFLVKVKVYLLGGHIVEALDAFPEDGNNGHSYAMNTFIQGEGAVVYGDAVIILDAMCGLEIVATEFIDLAAPENLEWRQSVEVFERMLLDEESKTDRPSETSPWAGPEAPEPGG